MIILGVISEQKGKNEKNKTQNERIQKENSEYDAVKRKKAIKLKDIDGNELLDIYPACISLLGLKDDGAIYELGRDESSKYLLIVNDFEKEVEEVRNELNDNFDFAFIIFTDSESTTLDENKLESNHVLEIINYLDDGCWVIQPTEFSKKTNKTYLVKYENSDIEIKHNAPILVKNINGEKKALTLSEGCFTKSHQINKND